jgi:hypothetical protein
MKPEDIREFTRKQPFEPYRIDVTGRQTYDIYHPDQVIVLRSRLIVGVAGEKDVPDRVEHLALIHIVRVEELHSERAIGQQN